MKEIVINKCHGGFGLSCEAMMLYAKLSGFKLYAYTHVIKDDRRDFHHYEPYRGQTNILAIHYHRKPLNKNKTLKAHGYFSDHDIKRDDPALIAVVRKLRKKANGRFADLKVVRIPNDVKWTISDYDGDEWVSEVHRIWA